YRCQMRSFAHKNADVSMQTRTAQRCQPGTTQSHAFCFAIDSSSQSFCAIVCADQPHWNAMVTIKDIAARLQVSPSTVGWALADDPRLSAATKKKVSEVANEMGYVANLAARMMRGVSSNLVGLVLPDIRNSFYSTI